jgi:ribonuclease BN (tRNA processing enzyme)
MGNEGLPDSARSHFAREIEQARQQAKGPDLFWRKGVHELDEIRILRRWNSHTPSLLDVWGGGYFLRWRGRGTIIDPGCSFVRLFRLHTPYGLDDVDMVVATHDHMDHCQDLATLISLFRAYNKWRGEQGMPTRVWDLLLSLGVTEQFGSLVANPENVPCLRWRRVIPPEDVKRAWDLPGGPCPGNPVVIARKYSYKLRAVKAFHKELVAVQSAMGLRFGLRGTKKTIVISGDTAISPSGEGADADEAAQAYRGASLLILHVGTMEKPGEPSLKQHLGLTGVVGILGKLAGDPPELVVLTEWGYEFGRLGLLGRSFFTKLVANELNRKGCDRYFAAIEGANPRQDQTPIIPADLNLRVSLPDFEVWSETRGFVHAAQIRAKEQAERIIFD